jgi:hypothetical protein
MRSLFGRLGNQLGRDQIILVSLAIAYVVTGKIGLMFGYVHPASTAVFPPAGIALGAFLVLGYRVWPVILIAATLLYGSVLGAVVAAPFLAAANTAEGLFLAYLVNRFAGGRHALQTPRAARRLPRSRSSSFSWRRSASSTPSGRTGASVPSAAPCWLRRSCCCLLRVEAIAGSARR